MSIYDTKHDNFRNAVIKSLRYVAYVSTFYDNEDEKTRYISTSVDAALRTITYCFPNKYYATLMDTNCRNLALNALQHAIDNNNIDSIDAESIFEELV